MRFTADAETFIKALKTRFHPLKKAGVPCSEEHKFCAILDGLPSSYGNFELELVDLSAENYTFAEAVEVFRWCSALDVTNRETRGLEPRALISSFKETDIVCCLCRVKRHRAASCSKLSQYQAALGPLSYTNDIGKSQPWYKDRG